MGLLIIGFFSIIIGSGLWCINNRSKIFPQKPQNLGTSLSNEDILYHKLSQDMNDMEDLRTRIEEGESCIISEEDFDYSNNRDNLCDSLLG